MAEKLLIYDGECAYCRSFVQLVRTLDRHTEIAVIPFADPKSQVLLRAQFGESYGFAMYLFEPKEVSWGAEAAQRITETLSLPRWLARLAFYVYPSLVKLVSKLARRTRPVCGPECAGLSHPAQKKQSAKIRESSLQELQRVLKSIAI